MMEQYLEIKAANPDCLLFYRMGDFYELFFGDAETASRALGIALTKRGKHLGEDIPMCGVPVHAANEYLQRLIRLGHRVAVCEQLEDPADARKRGYKAVVRRDVVRLVTPGTLTEDSLLDSGRPNYLAALARVKSDDSLALAWADISSGELAVTLTNRARLAADLARLEPGEIILPDSLLTDPTLAQLLNQSGAALTPLPSVRFDSASSERRLQQHFGVTALDAFGTFSRAEVASLGGLLDYILLTQVGRSPLLRSPRREEQGGAMLIDPATRANLELTRTLAGERAGSLHTAIDMTVSAGGARLLVERLTNPLTDVEKINRRLDEIGYFLEAGHMRAIVREEMARLPDMARALGRLSLGRGGPRDLAVLQDGLTRCASLVKILGTEEGLALRPPGIVSTLSILADAPVDLTKELERALADDLPILARDGGLVREGYVPELDEHRKLRDETRQVIAGLQATYAEITGIRSLKIRFNNVLGYFIEVSAQNSTALTTPEQAARFIHRQTMAGAMRFTTTELADLESRIAAASDRALAMEVEIFDRLVAEVMTVAPVISRICGALDTLDVTTALSELAERRRFVRPKIDSSLAFNVKDGRHPVVEQALERSASGTFISNSCDLAGDKARLWLLTGPNMAGKSTFLRQNALILILAQMGAYVPAAAAHIGVADRLFSRVGAADDLARGRSTFMVEMVETAAILNQATPHSFVILDEIGRGTATFDGLSIAWATVEHLHEINRSRGLFATHYHELTALSSRLPHLANATMKVREWKNEVVFLHEVIEGVADRSYGIHVAQLAGLPKAVIERASAVLALLEKSETATTRKEFTDDLPLFAAARPQAAAAADRREPDAVRRKLRGIIADELTPREALDLIYELKQLQEKP